MSLVLAARTSWNGGQSGSGRGLSWIRAIPTYTSTHSYNTPNSRIPDLQVHRAGFFGPRSFHAGGANALFGDGAVRFFSDNIDAALHRNLHSCNDGETVGPF